MLHLYTFSISHFSEKARWALDLNGLTYTEHILLPGAHMLRIKRLAPQTSVPLLQDGPHVVQGSGAILNHLAQNLNAQCLAAPAGLSERCAELDALADHAFGLGTQRIFYGPLLNHRRTIVDLWKQDGPWWGGAFYAVTFPLLAHGVRRAYGVEPGKVAKAKDTFRRAMDSTDQVLAHSPYLLGERLSRADITVAALLAPLCEPPEHRTRWPQTMPPEIAEFKAEFADRPTTAFVRRLYREHRHVVPAAKR